MKSRLLGTLLLLLVVAQVCGAAITAATFWEVRPTTGSNLNGACFDSTIANAGTDYSQQATAQLSLSDMATTGVTTTVTSVTGGFTAAMIGNCLHIESGTNWTRGFYQITAFTNSNTITVDTAPTSAAGVSGTGKVGGASLSFNGQTIITLAASLLAGQTVYVKNEAWNEAVTLTVAGTVGKPITTEGYNTTRGDAPTGSNRPRNNRASAATIPLTISNGQQIIKHLWLSNAGSGGNGITLTSSKVQFVNVRSSNNAGHGFSDNSTDNTYFRCEADTNTSNGFNLSGSGYYAVVASYAHNNTLIGIKVGSTDGFALVSNIVAANASHGISLSGGLNAGVLLNNTIDGNTGASTDGLNIPTGVTFGSGVLLANNIFSNSGRDGVRVTNGTATNTSLWTDYNDFFGNSGTARTNFPTGPHDVTTNPTFTNSAGGDYSLGTPLRNAGFPGTFPASTSIGYMDIGAVQSGQGAITQGACHRVAQ